MLIELCRLKSVPDIEFFINKRDFPLINKYGNVFKKSFEEQHIQQHILDILRYEFRNLLSEFGSLSWSKMIVIDYELYIIDSH